MHTSTTIATSIETAADKAKYDAACKEILAEKIILAWIMKSTMKEFYELSVQDISENYIVGTPQVAELPLLPDETNASKINGTGVEDTTITEGTITYDVRFYAVLPTTGETAGLIVNVEAQNDFYPGYPLIKRALYYCSRMISSQYGTEFTNSHYEKIKKVYSVWICLKPPKYRENTITGYSITESNIIGGVHEKMSDYDLLTAIMICIGKQNGTEGNGVLRLLDVLLSNETDTDTKKKILQDDFDIPMTQQLERRISDMCNLSEGVYQKGIEKGIEKGAEKQLISSIKSLMTTLHFTLDQAMDALQIDPKDRGKISSMIL